MVSRLSSPGGGRLLASADEAGNLVVSDVRTLGGGGSGESGSISEDIVDWSPLPFALWWSLLVVQHEHCWQWQPPAVVRGGPWLH